jgi:hypothetical protein
MFPYLVLLRMGFTMPDTIASAAVRSYRTISTLPAAPLTRFEMRASTHTSSFRTLACVLSHERQFRDIGGIFSVALSVASRRPAVSRHPAHWSPDFPLCASAQRLSGQLPPHHNIAAPENFLQIALS